LRTVFFLAALLSAASGLKAAPVLTLDQAYASALKQSESYASQKELLVQAEERFHQALGSILPAVSANGNWFAQDPNGIPASSANPQLAWQTTYKLSASWPLFRGFREYAALREAGALVRSQRWADQWAALQLYRDVAQAFYLVTAEQADLRTLEDEVGLYGKRIVDLKQRVRIGRSRTTEVLAAQSAQASLLAQKQSAGAQLVAAQQLLAFLTGLPEDTAVTAEVPGQEPASLDHYLGLTASRPDVKAAEENARAAGSAVWVAEGAHLPNVDAGANYYFQRPGLLQNVTWDAQIAVTLPLFLGGTVVSQTKQAESQARQADLALRLARRAAEDDIRTSWRNFQTDQAQVDLQKEAADLAKRNYEAEEKDYNYGLISNVEVLQALASSQDARRSYDRSRYGAETDFARLEAASAQVGIPAGR
jgi:outer membrane protein